MPEKYPEFGAKVRGVLRAKNITIEKFAEEIGVTDNFISKILSGYAPSFHVFIKIVNVLDISSDYLIQDYITSISDETLKSEPLFPMLSRAFSSLTKPQKEEILRLTEFLSRQ